MTVDIVLNGVSFGGKSALILQADFEERWWRDRSCPGWNSEQRSLNACHVPIGVLGRSPNLVRTTGKIQPRLQDIRQFRGGVPLL